MTAKKQQVAASGPDRRVTLKEGEVIRLPGGVRLTAERSHVISDRVFLDNQEKVLKDEAV